MRILHTSDWHLGHILYNYDRTEEQADMIRQVIDIVAEHRPDVFVLSGDVYHTSQPSAAVQTMFAESLMKMHLAHPEMKIVITAGNHDSGTKHEIFRTPWQALGVHMIGNLDREDMDSHIIEVPGCGYVIAVPYAYERNIPEGFFQQLLDHVAERNVDQLPVVMSAHTTVSGCDYRGHEQATDMCVGGIDSLDVAELGQGYDYLALGHIHHEQFVHTGHHNVRYSGTPIAVSFDEDYPHSVSLVTIDSHGATPVVQQIEIKNLHPLVSLPPQNAVSWTEAKRQLAEFPSDNAAYIRLNVEVDDFLPPTANAEAAALTADKECRFCYINTKRKREQKVDARNMTVNEFQTIAPLEIAQRYAAAKGIGFDDDMEELFGTTVRMVHEEEREREGSLTQ